MVDTTFSPLAASITSGVMASVNTQMSPSLSRTRESRSCGASSPSLRSTSHAASSVANADDGIRRVRRTLGFMAPSSTYKLQTSLRTLHTLNFVLVLVSVRFAVAAVIARDGGLDHAGAFGVRPGGDGEQA